MMNFKTPGVYLRETEVVQPKLAQMSVTGFVGQAERGPLDYPQQINSWGQFRDIFGGFVGYAYLPYSVFGFFLNGGERCYVVRVAHETARPAHASFPSVALTSVSSALAAGVNEASVESARNIRIGTEVLIDDGLNRARVRVTNKTIGIKDNIIFEPAETDASGNLIPLPTINAGASISMLMFDAYAINAGQWGNDLSASVEDKSSRDLILTELSEDLNAGASVAKFKSVAGLTGAEISGDASADRVTLQDRRNPIQEEITIQSINYVTREVTFTTSVKNSFLAGSGVNGRGFKLVFRYRQLDQLVREEVFDNLSMNPGHERYFVRVINGEPEESDYVKRIRNGNSILVRGVALCERRGVALCERRGVACPRPQNIDDEQFKQGDEDPSKLEAKYFTGYDKEAYFRPQPTGADAATREKIKAKYFGLASYELVSEVGLIAIPDLIIPDYYQSIAPTQIPKQGIIFAKATASVRRLDNLKQGQRDMLRHCEKMGDRFALLDSPRGAGTEKGANKIEDWSSLFQLSSGAKNGALYYPWLREKTTDFEGRDLLVPSSGHVAGIYARVESERGIGHAPANELLHGIVEFEVCLTDAEQSLLNPRGINCLRSFPGRGQRVWGARTLSLNPMWRYVNVRRLCLAIIKQILINLQWAVFEPNDRRLWNTIAATLNLFLNDLYQSGVLLGATPEQAFFVKCDEETNSPESIERGEVITQIGFAPARPAEFVLVTIKRTAESISVRERGRI